MNSEEEIGADAGRKGHLNLTLRASYGHLAGVSNTTRYDAFLLRRLAAELNRELHDRRVRDVAFDRGADRLLVSLDQHMLEWSLDPVASGPRFTESAEVEGKSLVLPKKARIDHIDTPPDERILTIHIAGGKRPNATTSIVIELVGTSWNIVALDSEARIRKTLRKSTDRTPGSVYTYPAESERAGAVEPIDLESWINLLAHIPPHQRASALQRNVAYTSGINVFSLLDAAAESEDPAEVRVAYNRYLELMQADTTPVLLRDGMVQPYPFALRGVESQTCDSLVDAFAAARADQSITDRTNVGRAISREQKKLQRLEQESREGAADAERLRASGDLLLANLYLVKRGMTAVQLTGFDGEPVSLELDPAVTPSDNAQNFYEQARKRQRAAERLPALIDAANIEIARLEEVLRRVEAGETPELGLPQARVRKAAPPQGRSFPYRRYRTTGGLEVRVGRTGRSNDELTFHHAAPDEIWLHARDVGGAHVVLRWTGDGNPPRQDLTEAAILAALHSKARSSGTVPVDWTRRKYVRKPRRSAPGKVLVERASTIFVEPDAELKEKLRWPGDPLEG